MTVSQLLERPTLRGFPKLRGGKSAAWLAGKGNVGVASCQGFKSNKTPVYKRHATQLHPALTRDRLKESGRAGASLIRQPHKTEVGKAKFKLSVLAISLSSFAEATSSFEGVTTRFVLAQADEER